MPRYSEKRKAAVDAMVKKDICKAVSRILAKSQPQNLTMELVAHEAGMAKGTLYNYFKNKADLVAYVVADIARPYEERLEKIANSDMPVPEKLRAIAELNMLICSENEDFLSIMAECASQSFSQSFAQDEVKESRGRGEKRVTKIIEQGLREGIFKRIAADDLVMAYSGIVEWFTRRRLNKRKNRTIKKDAKMAMEIFMDGASA